MRDQRRGQAAGCVVHSDRGSQFRSRKFVRALNRYGLFGSMGRVRSLVVTTRPRRSVYELVQKGVLDRRYSATRGDLRIAIVTWIKRTRHRRRRQAVLG